MTDYYNIINDISLSIVERIAAALEVRAANPALIAMAESCLGGSELATAFKKEARRRVDAARFFGHISYTSLIAVKD